MRRLFPFLFTGVTAVQAPSALCERGADGWLEGDPDTVEALARAVEAEITGPLGAGDYGTGVARFDGEWWFGTYQMAALGFGQVALQDPATREQNVLRMRASIDALIRPEVWAFDRDAWGHFVLDDLDGDRHDHAVVGYLGVALGVERLVDPDGPHAELHDEVVAFLVRRLEARNGRPLSTYPGEAYPVDMSAVLAAVGLHARATGTEPPEALRHALVAWEARYVQPDGLVVQSVDPSTGRGGTPRGSGTALAAYFLGFTEPRLARRLGEGLRDTLGDEVMGFGAVREYRPGVERGGDIDSGPLIMGFSVSATGFSLASARRLEDDAWFTDLWGTTCFFGVPSDGGFLTGGPLGNAILFAMLTAS